MSMPALLIATSDMSWTPEAFYFAAGIIHLVVILFSFRLQKVPAEYNKFINAVIIAGAINLIAYFTMGFGMIGILIVATLAFLFLVAGSRGALFQSFITWLLILGVYWGGAYYVVEMEYALQSEELGGIPYLMLEGEMEAKGVTQQDYRRVRD